MIARTTVLPPILRVTEREIRFFLTSWKGTAFSTFAAPVLLLVALGVGLGGLVADRPSLAGLSYLDFLAPGLAIAAAAQLGAGMALWPIMAGHRWLGFHRAMVATPVGPAQIVPGYLLWVALRGTAQATVFLGVATLVGGVDSFWGLAAPLVGGVTAAAFAAPLMAYTATCDSDRAFDPIMRVVVTPLYLFSGAFFPTSQLPDAVATLARVFPLWHGIELARWATTGSRGATAPVVNVAVLAVWIGAGYALARSTFTRRLTP